MPDPVKSQPKRVEITLKHPHDHGGVLHPAGAKISVWPDQAERIQAHELAMDKSATMTQVNQ